jgi:hypothetical protein
VGIETSGINESRFEIFSFVKTEQKYLLNKDALSESFVTVVPES